MSDRCQHAFTSHLIVSSCAIQYLYKKNTVKNQITIINNDLFIIIYCRSYIFQYFRQSTYQLETEQQVTNTNVYEMKIHSIFGICTDFTQNKLSL